jgi:CopG family transcriptional regulator, nickel-responsive regulator
MKAELARFGVAMEAPLLAQFDALVAARDSTRSEVLRDLVRSELVRTHVARGVDAVAALTLVYKYSSPEVQERLTAMQQALGPQVRCTTHVHLAHDYCLQVLVLEGKSDVLRAHADRLLATKGVKHGGLELITDLSKHRLPAVLANPAEPAAAGLAAEAELDARAPKS